MQEEIRVLSQKISKDDSYTSFQLSDGRELCLERCMNGFDVALYDSHQMLLGEKVCTNSNLEEDPYDHIVIKALSIAQKLLTLPVEKV